METDLQWCGRSWFFLALLTSAGMVTYGAADGALPRWVLWLCWVPVSVPIAGALLVALLGLWLDAASGLIRWASRKGR